ncbi:hypothetical protein [Mycoplasma sp. 31_09]|uniref:hypothetical protein n=2 Tax=Mycoplasma TaxID=2093 RepID=UPI003AAF5CD4
MDKIMFGKFYTISNPFKNLGFFTWAKQINLLDDENINNIIALEPFAGTNNIPLLLSEAGINLKWKCYDINHKFDSENNIVNHYDDFPIEIRDTIKNYPAGYDYVFTNPPYLARNSASKKGMQFINTKYDDQYKECLSLMLKNNKFIAAIVPETFITSNEPELKSRLHTVISLTMKMFDDTECPVCLALFVDYKTEDFDIYRNDIFLGKYNQELKKYLENPRKKNLWKFNDNDGEIWLTAIDNTKQNSISFRLANKNDKRVNISSRSYTRIKIPENMFSDVSQISSFIYELNLYLEEYRQKTFDVFLSSFKGLRQDNKYRRRLSWLEAKRIMDIVYEKKNWLTKRN